MHDKFTVIDLALSLYTRGEISEILGIHPSTLTQALKNPDWVSTKKYLTQLQQHIAHELDAAASNTEYPEHKAWLKATQKYLKTLELIDG